jgi:hypothetical protein
MTHHKRRVDTMGTNARKIFPEVFPMERRDVFYFNPLRQQIRRAVSSVHVQMAGKM